MKQSILDASALLALLNQEHGSEQVAKAIADGAVMSAVNFSEVVAKLGYDGMTEAAIHESLDSLGLKIVEFDVSLAYQTGFLRPLTKRSGLSLGDRACLALAQHLNLPALTADKAWQGLSLGVTIQIIR